MSDPFAAARLSNPGYRGSVERPAPLLELHAREPWDATVTVTPLRLQGYESAHFEVAAAWTGPPLVEHPEIPPPAGPVAARDQIMLTDLELARAVARRAHEQLARGQKPDLWVLAGNRR